jgi:hypothetical protein
MKTSWHKQQDRLLRTNATHKIRTAQKNKVSSKQEALIQTTRAAPHDEACSKKKKRNLKQKNQRRTQRPALGTNGIPDSKTSTDEQDQL